MLVVQRQHTDPPVDSSHESSQPQIAAEKRMEARKAQILCQPTDLVQGSAERKPNNMGAIIIKI